MLNFCPACNGASFQDYKGRPKALCAVCKTMERHRLFALFLLAQDMPPEAKVCVIKKGVQPSAYIQRLSAFANIEISDAGSFENFSEKNSCKFDLVYHNHIVNDGFQINDSYRRICNEVEKIMKSGGIQVFSPGPVAIIKDISQQIRDDCLDELEYTRNAGLNQGAMHRYTPVYTYGKNILEACVLRVNFNKPIGGNDLIVSRKA